MIKDRPGTDRLTSSLALSECSLQCVTHEPLPSQEVQAADFELASRPFAQPFRCNRACRLSRCSGNHRPPIGTGWLVHAVTALAECQGQTDMRRRRRAVQSSDPSPCDEHFDVVHDRSPGLTMVRRRYATGLSRSLRGPRDRTRTSASWRRSSGSMSIGAVTAANLRRPSYWSSNSRRSDAPISTRSVVTTPQLLSTPYTTSHPSRS